MIGREGMILSSATSSLSFITAVGLSPDVTCSRGGGGPIWVLILSAVAWLCRLKLFLRHAVLATGGVLGKPMGRAPRGLVRSPPLA